MSVYDTPKGGYDFESVLRGQERPWICLQSGEFKNSIGGVLNPSRGPTGGRALAILESRSVAERFRPSRPVYDSEAIFSRFKEPAYLSDLPIQTLRRGESCAIYGRNALI